jgi:hypothetical protein
VAVRRAPICWQQIEQRALVLVGLVLGPSHAKNLAGHLCGRSRPGRVNPRRRRCRYHCPAGRPTEQR